MTETVGEMIAAIDGAVPLDKAAGWDAVGLQVGDAATEAATVAVCHEVTEDVVGHVESSPVDFIVSYHSLLFRPPTTLRPGSDPAGRAYRLIRAGIAVGVVHTAFDVAPGGAADALATDLDLDAVVPFAPVWGADTVKIVTFAPAQAIDQIAGAMRVAGGGRIGHYRGCSFRADGIGAFIAPEAAAPSVGEAGADNRQGETRVEMIAPRRAIDAVVAAMVAAHPYEEPAFDVIDTASNAGFAGRHGTLPKPVSLQELARQVAAAIGGVIRIADAGRGAVSRIAVVPGSGSSVLSTLPPSVEVLVTGDVTHHRAREALDRGVSIIDPGHIATERPGIERLVTAIRSIRPDTIDLTHMDASPWRAH